MISDKGRLERQRLAADDAIQSIVTISGIDAEEANEAWDAVDRLFGEALRILVSKDAAS